MPSRRPGKTPPHGRPWAALNKTARQQSKLRPRAAVWYPQGGRRDGTTNPSRRLARPARAPFKNARPPSPTEPPPRDHPPRTHPTNHVENPPHPPKTRDSPAETWDSPAETWDSPCWKCRLTALDRATPPPRIARLTAPERATHLPGRRTRPPEGGTRRAEGVDSPCRKCRLTRRPRLAHGLAPTRVRCGRDSRAVWSRLTRRPRLAHGLAPTRVRCGRDSRAVWPRLARSGVATRSSLRQFFHPHRSRRGRPSCSVRPVAQSRSAHASVVRSTDGSKRARTRAQRSGSGSHAVPSAPATS